MKSNNLIDIIDLDNEVDILSELYYKKEETMTKSVTVTMSEDTYKMFLKLKTEFKSNGMTVTELFKQMILKFAEGRK